MSTLTISLAARAATTALLLWGAGASAPNASAATVQGYAHVGDSAVPPTADSAGGSSNNGARIAGAAVLGAGQASFDVAPALGVGGFSGQSAAVSLADANNGQRQTQADGYLKVIDRFHIDGELSGPASGSFVVRMNGSLLPNAELEDAIFTATGRAQLTARALLALSFTHYLPGTAQTTSTQLNQVARWLGPGNPCTVACVVSPTVAMEIVVPFTLDANTRDFGFDITLGAVGSLGGGYGLGGAPVSGGAATFNGGAAAPFFSIELVLPQGLGYTAEGGHFMQLAAVPEPAAWQLMALALLGAVARAGWIRRRSGRHSVKQLAA